jgi:hypothetical protein
VTRPRRSPSKTAPTKAGSNGSKGAASRAKVVADATAPAGPKPYTATIYPHQEPLPEALAECLGKLQAELNMPVWLLLQDNANPAILRAIDEPLLHFVKHDLANVPSEPFALVVNSPGGDARTAYLLARMLRRRSQDFVAVVPDAAMSAATLLALGASEIIMGTDAYLGPLDAQIMDHDTESFGSVLNETQSLERLRAYNMESIDEVMFLLAGRTNKRIETLLPTVLSFVAECARPLFEKIDVVHYTERARVLKVGEEYASRLLRDHHSNETARSIASALVEKYPEHGFPIDRDEAKGLGLRVADLSDDMKVLLEELWQSVQNVTALGAYREMTS